LASLRLLSPVPRLARPAADLEVRALGYGASESRDFSTWQLSARPGLLVDLLRGVLLAYRFEALQVAAGDRYGSGPLWFSNGHRAELEVALPRSLLVFGGAGRRLFREDGRTRTEADLGVGASVKPAAFVNLLGAVTGRGHWAQNPAYDLWGGTLLVSAEWKLPLKISLRTGILGAIDRFPRSAGFFGTSQARRDLLLKASLGLFASTSWEGVRVGATYEASSRSSTASSYSFDDHRVFLKLVWASTWDPFSPRAVEPAGHVALDWGFAKAGVEERVQDMLRQDEALQRGSSCVER
jgi:hypothetical protein